MQFQRLNHLNVYTGGPSHRCLLRLTVPSIISVCIPYDSIVGAEAWDSGFRYTLPIFRLVSSSPCHCGTLTAMPREQGSTLLEIMLIRYRVRKLLGSSISHDPASLNPSTPCRNPMSFLSDAPFQNPPSTEFFQNQFAAVGSRPNFKQVLCARV